MASDSKVVVMPLPQEAAGEDSADAKAQATRGGARGDGGAKVPTPVVVMPVEQESAGEDSADAKPQANGSGGAGGGGGDKGLTPLQRRAIQLLAEGKSKAAAARELGIDRSTIHRWFGDAVFKEEHDLAVNEFLEDARAAARGDVRLAMDTLRETMEEYPGRSSAVTAAVAVLRMTGLDKPD